MLPDVLVKLYLDAIRHLHPLPALAVGVHAPEEQPTSLNDVLVQPQLLVELASMVALAADGAERTAAG